MNEQERFMLLVISRLVGYPEDNLMEGKNDLFQSLAEELEQEDIKLRLLAALEPLYQMPLQELRESYVSAFDWVEGTGLYLTAHELGDSRDRGAALILLQHIISDAGFGLADGELADYIPALYELIAVAPENVYLKALKRRLAVATKQIAEHLPPEHPYASIYQFLVSDIFGEPPVEDIRKLEHSRETTDLADMPYPILYGRDGTTRADVPAGQMRLCNE